MIRVIRFCHVGIGILLFLLGAYSCEGDNKPESLTEVNEVFNNINQVRIEGSFCDVSITPNQELNNNINFSGWIIDVEEDREVAIKYEVIDGTLDIWVVRPENIRDVIGEISLSVPVNIEINIENSSGNVMLKELSPNDEIKIESASGSIFMDHLKANLDITTSSGIIEIVNHDGDIIAISTSGKQVYNNLQGNLTVETSSGGVNMSYIEGKVNVKTISGSQQLSNVNGNVDLEAISGKLELDTIAGSIKAKTNNGLINLSETSGDINLETISGMQLGQSVLLTDNSVFQSITGNIDMQFVNNEEDLSFFLTSNVGRMSVYGIEEYKEFEVLGGDIRVEGYTQTGTQTYH